MQTAGLFDVNVTASPELAVALRAGMAAPRVCGLSDPKVMVCGVGEIMDPVTLNVLVTGVAVE